jgi:hypothetical protein
MQNLKTTVAGALTIAIPVLGGFLKRFYLNEPLAETDWAIIFAAITTGVGLIFAGDATAAPTKEGKVP